MRAKRALVLGSAERLAAQWVALNTRRAARPEAPHVRREEQRLAGPPARVPEQARRYERLARM
jgi:hypothetical protein